MGEEQKNFENDVKPEVFAKDVLGFEEIQDEDEEADMIQSEQVVYVEDETGPVVEDSNEGDEGQEKSR
jgi:hypothetical protein